MITGLFLTILLGLMSLLVGFLPTAQPLPTAVFDWVSYFHAGAQIIGIILPLNQFYIILGLVITIEGILLGYKIALFIFGWIRGGH